MAKNIDILREELQKYSGKKENKLTYFTENREKTVFSVVSVGDFDGSHRAITDLIVQIIDNKIVIGVDTTHNRLHHALVRAGIPREQIILAYAGEVVPDTA